MKVEDKKLLVSAENCDEEVESMDEDWDWGCEMSSEEIEDEEDVVEVLDSETEGVFWLTADEEIEVSEGINEVEDKLAETEVEVEIILDGVLDDTVDKEEVGGWVVSVVEVDSNTEVLEDTGDIGDAGDWVVELKPEDIDVEVVVEVDSIVVIDVSITRVDDCELKELELVLVLAERVIERTVLAVL